MINHRYSKLFAITVIAGALSACNSTSETYTLPLSPKSITKEFIISEPTLSGMNVAVVDGDIPVTNDKHNTVAYMKDYNPIVQILSGFDDIWSLGDDTWSNNASTSRTTTYGVSGVSGGASNSTNEALLLSFNHEQVKNGRVWKENFDYVTNLKRQGESAPDVDRTNKSAMAKAYLDDQRDKGYSLTSGLGPFAQAYRDGANSKSPYSTDNSGNVIINGKTLDVMNVTYQNNLYQLEGLAAERTGYGTTTDSNSNPTKLSDVVTLLQKIAAYGASTEAPKYHFESPRPWRMKSDYTVASFSDINDLTKNNCVAADGSTVNELRYYDRPTTPLVTPMKGLLCAARTIYTKKSDGTFTEGYTDTTLAENWVSGRAKDGAFPSGHTTEAVDRGLGFAYAIPERFTEMVMRASDLGENRIVAAMHSPLDVIGGRIMGLAVTAATLNDVNNSAIAAAAVNQAKAYFTAQMAGQYSSLYDYAHCTTDADHPCSATDEYADHAALKTRYKAYMTYGFTPLNENSIAPEVPKGAEVLLASRQPYLTAAQRRSVLATTEINSNYPVINQSRGWGRINLVDAADGYGAFDHDVELYMNASLGGFNAKDRWRNDISGIGRLHKLGTGSLSLEGHNTYTGGTLLDEGTLIATSSTAFGSNVLYQKDGTVEVSIATGKDDRSQGELNVSDYVMIAGTLSLNLANNAHIKASNNLYVADTLQLTIPTITTSQTYQILSGHRLYGTFKTISAQDKNGVSYAVSVQYTDNSASVTVSPRAS